MAEPNENLDDNLAIRINKDALENFKKKTDKPYQMMIREMITAFNEDRLRIILTGEQKQSLKIYQS